METENLAPKEQTNTSSMTSFGDAYTRNIHISRHTRNPVNASAVNVGKEFKNLPTFDILSQSKIEAEHYLSVQTTYSDKEFSTRNNGQSA